MQEIYLLKSCNEWAERSSAKIVSAAFDRETLRVTVAGEILCGNMDYCGFTKNKGYLRFLEDVKRNIEVEKNLTYGYVETIDCLAAGDKDILIEAYHLDDMYSMSEDNEEVEDFEM